FADGGEDGFELAAIDDFEIYIDLGVKAVGAALKIVNVTAGVTDDGGDFGQEAGAVFGANQQLHEELGGLAFATPFPGNRALGLVEEVLDVGTRGRVDGDAATARDIADDVVAGNRITTLGAIDEKVAVTFDDERSFAEAKHALDSLDDRRRGFFGVGL